MILDCSASVRKLSRIFSAVGVSSKGPRSSKMVVDDLFMSSFNLGAFILGVGGLRKHLVGSMTVCVSLLSFWVEGVLLMRE